MPLKEGNFDVCILHILGKNEHWDKISQFVELLVVPSVQYINKAQTNVKAQSAY